MDFVELLKVAEHNGIVGQSILLSSCYKNFLWYLLSCPSADVQLIHNQPIPHKDTIQNSLVIVGMNHFIYRIYRRKLSDRQGKCLYEEQMQTTNLRKSN